MNIKKLRQFVITLSEEEYVALKENLDLLVEVWNEGQRSDPQVPLDDLRKRFPAGEFFKPILDLFREF